MITVKVRRRSQNRKKGGKRPSSGNKLNEKGAKRENWGWLPGVHRKKEKKKNPTPGRALLARSGGGEQK